MRRRISRRAQKKYDPSVTFSSKDIRLAISLSLGKKPNIAKAPKEPLKLPLKKSSPKVLNKKKDKNENNIKLYSNGCNASKSKTHAGRVTKSNNNYTNRKSNNNNTKRKRHKNSSNNGVKKKRKGQIKNYASEKVKIVVKKVRPSKVAIKKNSRCKLQTPKTPPRRKTIYNHNTSIIGSSSGRAVKKLINNNGFDMYKGVKKIKTGTGRYRASLVFHGGKYKLGDYDSSIGAACSYDQARINILNGGNVDDNDLSSLNFDWYMPKTNYSNIEIIRCEYIRMLTKKKASSSNHRSKSPTVESEAALCNHKNKKGFSMSSARRHIIDNSELSEEEQKEKEQLQKQEEKEMLNRIKEQNKREELQCKNWWFNDYQSNTCFVDAEVNQFLTQPK